MTDNEKLIEEAAAQRYPHRNVFLEGMAYMSEERSRIPLREAFVEGAKWQAEAHTPTDDEREALLGAMRLGWSNRQHWWTTTEAPAEAPSDDEFLADAILAAGFRRSEVPQSRGMSDQIYALLDEMNEEGGRINYSDYSVLHGMVSQLANAEPQGEPSAATECEYIDAEIGATCQNFYDTPCETGDCGESYCWTCNACEACKANDAEPGRAEQQGEPSDAQVEAAGALLYGISWGTDIADPDLVRDALRAAGVVGQEGEQNHG